MIQLSTSQEPAFIVARIKNLWKKTKKLRQKPQKTLSFVLFCQSLNAYYSFSTDDLALGELSTQGISTGGLARLAVKWPKICRKTAEIRCWKTAETQLLENGRNIWGCWKTAEISAVFEQSTVLVGKWPKFRPFSYNP